MSNLALPAQLLGELTPDNQTGQRRRFACRCGLKTFDSVEGMMHTFASLEERSPHDVYIERFSLGMWHYDRKSLGKETLERMRRKGETVGEFAQRMTTALRTATDTLERMEAE